MTAVQDDPRIVCETCGDWGEVDVPTPRGEVAILCPNRCPARSVLEGAMAVAQGAEAA